ncbi:nucleotidyltransferase family protein [Leptospira perdikensis]|uniref:CBS domain-containing protein n=1 Tax=Leptospira perdikensis TaxID=2484948 RepID=A0A4R9JMG3_9LEPT|nr:nucleotidyltransferase family protein [Leptospira perdikensis]TGL45827.1 CBS domain-containing protein [Leptospira perdikensis]
MIKNLNTLQIASNQSIRAAMKQLDETAEKILFVVDEDEKLVGSLSDGDIRRWILQTGKIDGSLVEIGNIHCYSVELKYNPEEVKKEMVARKINIVPVLSADKKIQEFLIWDQFFEGKFKKKVKNQITNPVVIMAGGKGTRLDPFTKILPKPLIPIGEKTILEIIIDRFLDYEVKDFYFTVNHKAGFIKSYFDELKKLYNVHYVDEQEFTGTAGSLKLIEGKFTDPIILTNCDIIIEADYSDILNHHIELKNQITMVTSMKNYKIPYGVCEIDSNANLVGMKEKPEFNFLINTGMYIVNPDMIQLIPKNTMFHMTDLIAEGQKRGLKVGVYPISENSWIDVGEWEEYRKALKKLT